MVFSEKIQMQKMKNVELEEKEKPPFWGGFSLVRRSKNEKVICWLVGSLFQFSNFS